MKVADLAQALRGIQGEFDIQRILGALGTLVYIFTAPALVWAGKVQVSFDTFCLSYSGGLGACVLTAAGAIAIKDRNVARAKAVGQGQA